MELLLVKSPNIISVSCSEQLVNIFVFEIYLLIYIGSLFWYISKTSTQQSITSITSYQIFRDDGCGQEFVDYSFWFGNGLVIEHLLFLFSLGNFVLKCDCTFLAKQISCNFVIHQFTIIISLSIQ
ncbi:Hypothetical_protein [Hexamita inflata]|uniref:Hypothetical_protein n=1 Tax=Hexamita inflata TaxID=28002 RepID=A0AA86N859_9EUKA|nr:Hypothetical protein HINF_LOCUS2126 [Hexamita inflata]